MGSVAMDELALRGLGPVADSCAQHRALAYFEQLKASEDGWQLCADALIRGFYSDDHIKFFCFQVLEHHIKHRYPVLLCAQRQLIRDTMMTWLQTQTVRDTPEKPFVRNKAAQIFSLLFISEYPATWPKFFFDVLSVVGSAPGGVDLYLRILVAIDVEVVDREILHTPEEARRNILIKDHMREHCVPDLVESWYQILHTYQCSNAELTCLCLDVIGAYVSWIDINLIANDRFVGLLLSHLSVDMLRESACDCLFEMVGKGMDPVDKTKLVELLSQVLQAAGFFNLKQDDDVDFLARFSKLLNGMGQSLLQSAGKLAKSGDVANSERALSGAESKVPVVLELLAHEDDDISLNVTTFCYDYLHAVKQLPSLSDQQRANVEAILMAIIKKLAYDEEFNFENEGEEEAMFMEYRKQLKLLLDKLAQVAPALLVITVHRVVTATLQNWKEAKFLEVEVALRLLYMLGEAIPVSQGVHFSGDPAKASAMQEMMRIMVTSGVSHYAHPAVILQFFETVVRYDKFFSLEPQHIPEVLMAFLDGRGLRHGSLKVRSRCSYLLSRFVKVLSKHIFPFMEEILTRVQDLLTLTPRENGLHGLLSSEDQLFIYEMAGALIVSSETPAERKALLMGNLLLPLTQAFPGLLAKLLHEPDQERQAAIADCLSHAVGFVSRTSKAFSSKQTVRQCGCADVYLQCLRLFLPALGCPVQREALRGAVRTYLHRMVVCLEEEVLPFLPEALQASLRDCEPRDIQELIPLLNQVIGKFKAQIVPFLQQVFVPLVTTVFEVLARPAEENDQSAALDRQALRRNYFQFIYCIVSSGVADVISSQGSAQMEQVLVTVIQGAVDFPDPVAQKICFNILSKLVELWGGKDGLPGFGDFMYKSIVPACFMAPLKPTFDLMDAQTILALAECASTLKIILQKRGPELTHFLQHEYLPTLSMAPEVTEEFCQALEQADLKVFKNYLKAFFQRAKS